MKTAGEVEKLKNIEQTLHEFTKAVHIQINDEDMPEDISASFIGTPMAAIDALFAIRDGEEWRGLNSPEFIARKILQEMGIGE